MEQSFIKRETLFIDEIFGLVVVTMLDEKVKCILMPKIKFVRNSVTLDVLYLLLI